MGKRGVAEVLAGWAMAPAFAILCLLAGSLFIVEARGVLGAACFVLFLFVTGTGLLVGGFLSGELVALGIRDLWSDGARNGMLSIAMRVPPAWLGALVALATVPGTVLKVSVPVILCGISYVPLFPHRTGGWLDSLQRRVGKAVSQLDASMWSSPTVLVRCAYVWALFCIVASSLLLIMGGYGLAHLHPFLSLFTILVMVSSVCILPLLLVLAVRSRAISGMSKACFWFLILPFCTLAASALLAGVMLAR